jgi:hypothetical protein
MSSGVLLSRAWDTFWNNKFLILLGVLVVLGSGGGRNFSGGPQPFAESEEFFSVLRPRLALSDDAVDALICVVIIVSVALWVVRNIARGGLIAGVDEIETDGASGFGRAWNAGWQKGWRLSGIGLIPAIPVVVLVLILSAFGMTFFGAEGLDRAALAAAGAGVVIVVLTTLCLALIASLVLEWLRVLANRACMLEDTGVFESYGRGWEVLRENLRQGVALVLIQIGIQIALGLPLLISIFIMPYCCLMWLALWPIGGAFSAYFSTVWTLAWREWTSKGAFVEQALSNN